MNLRLIVSATVVLALLVSPALALRADLGGGEGNNEFTFLGPTAWDPGLNTSRTNVGPAPGGASWSAMPAGITISGNAVFETITGGGDHPDLDTTTDIETMITAGADGLEYGLFNSAFNVWAAAAAITNLGKVADGALIVPTGAVGDAEAFNGHLGDIRVAGLTFDGAFGVLAHAYAPGTETSDFFHTIGGDVHFDVGETWADDPTDTTGDADFDFFTVALHELGHSLGLGHSEVVGSVMEPIYAGARRTLHPDDIAGIQAIYGVPEPTSIVLVLLGSLGLLAVRRRG